METKKKINNIYNAVLSINNRKMKTAKLRHTCNKNNEHSICMGHEEANFVYI